MNKSESSDLFHELWHAEQIINETSAASAAGSVLNREIESRYVEYLYQQKQSDYSSKWESQYTDQDWGISIAGLKDYIDAKGNLQSGSSGFDLDTHLMNHVAPTLREDFGDAYKNATYDYGRGIETFQNLNKLSKNC